MKTTPTARCGECGCPTQPGGQSAPCTTDDECWDPRKANETASRCVNGRCEVCRENADCPADAPLCIDNTVGSTSLPVCAQCTEDSDCPAERPFCVMDGLSFTCRECRTTADCARGVCNRFECAAGCGESADCPDPATHCGAEERCVAIPCTSDDHCPKNTTCSAGVCGRVSCRTDGDCPDGVCVDNRCHETFGRCYVELGGP